MWSLAWLQAFWFMTAHMTVAQCEPCWAHMPWRESPGTLKPYETDEEWYDTRSVICVSPKVDFICTWSGCEAR